MFCDEVDHGDELEEKIDGVPFVADDDEDTVATGTICVLPMQFGSVNYWPELRRKFPGRLKQYESERATLAARPDSSLSNKFSKGVMTPSYTSESLELDVPLRFVLWRRFPELLRLLYNQFLSENEDFLLKNTWVQLQAPVAESNVGCNDKAAGGGDAGDTGIGCEIG